MAFFRKTNPARYRWPAVSIAEFYAVFRTCWPALPVEWIAEQKHRWGPLLRHLDDGTPYDYASQGGDNLEIMTSNMSGVWFFSKLPGVPTESMAAFIDLVIEGMGPTAERARPDFMRKAQRLIDVA